MKYKKVKKQNNIKNKIKHYKNKTRNNLNN